MRKLVLAPSIYQIILQWDRMFANEELTGHVNMATPHFDIIAPCDRWLCCDFHMPLKKRVLENRIVYTLSL